jgi:DNA-binding transcriptional ArsR family regulator
MSSEGAFIRALPREGWLRDYTIWRNKSEIPPQFHFYSAVAAIAGASQRNVWMNRRTYTIYPGSLIILVSPSGVCHKTIAAKLARKVLREAVPETRFISETITPEAIVQALARGKAHIRKDDSGRPLKIDLKQDSPVAHGFIYAPEMGTLIDKREYKSGLIPLITRLADSPDIWSSETIGRGLKELRNVTLSAIMCIQPDTLVEQLPEMAFKQGFMARFIYVVRHDSEEEWPDPEDCTEDELHSLIVRLTSISQMKGEMTRTKEAVEWYEAYYHEHKKSRPDDLRIAAYWARKPDHVLRMGMILALSRLSLIVETVDLEDARRLLTIIEPEAFELFQGVGFTATLIEDAERVAQKEVLKRLKKYGRIQHSTLLQRLVPLGLKKAEVTHAINILEESGLVETINEQTLGENKRMYSKRIYMYKGLSDEQKAKKERRQASKERRKAHDKGKLRTT